MATASDHRTLAPKIWHEIHNLATIEYGAVFFPEIVCKHQVVIRVALILNVADVGVAKELHKT